MTDLKPHLDQAVASGKLLESSAKNILQLLARASSPVYAQSIRELVERGEWAELNDRFFRTLAFGTGGLRGRTIGKVVTDAERGTPDAQGRPEHPCVGTNSMNFFNVSRAVQGLVAYVKEWLALEGRNERGSIAIAHDTRFFSREFAELCARVAVELGCDAHLVEGPRSTPELSFAVRETRSHAGIVLTASHNPPHDNGFKCYFADGGQVVEPHASAIIAKVNATESDVYTPLPVEQQGKIHTLGGEIDEAYMHRLDALILDRGVIAAAKNLRVVYTSLHGTGGVIVKPMLARLGVQFTTVPEQDAMDGLFPTVKSPNPENAEALAMAIALAEKSGADLVMATDPDCDRMGIAARNAAGKMELFTGNQIGSLLAWYRVHKLREQGVLTEANAARGVIIKTFVTSDLQRAIAEKNGLRCVETLTGFKFNSEKLEKYEHALPAEIRAKYRTMSEAETRAARLAHSSYYVAGGEESYGYSGADFVRDKDGNGAVVMFTEVAAHAKVRGLTLDRLLDEIYAEYGFYFEMNGNLVFEGAEGAAKIQRLIDTYASEPPREFNGVAVTASRNFGVEDIFDCEGDKIPKEKMLAFDLANGGRVTVRPSGTEPKIKYYLFAVRAPESGGTFTPEQLAAIKNQTRDSLDDLWAWLQKDAARRVSA